MKNVNVNFPDLKRINQFGVLPSRYIHGGMQWSIFNDEATGFEVASSNLVNKYDMVIGHAFNELCVSPYNPMAKRVYALRYSKDVQSAILRRIADKLNPVNYVHLDSSTVALDGDVPKIEIPESKNGWIIKPIAGARSLGVVVVPSKCNLRSLFTEMRRIRESGNINNDTLIKLWEKFGCTHNLGAEKYPDEMARTMLDSSSVLLQKKLKYTKFEEWRILKSPDVYLCIKRDNLEGNDPTIINTMSPTITDNAEISRAIEMMTAELPQEFGSVDVWYHRETGSWGIFEFQPQYGHVHVPEEVHMDFLKDTLAALYRNLGE